MSHEGTVVVADDTQANLDMVCRMLRRNGYLVHAALDGASALACVHRELPDLVVSDVMMPGLDGFELCRRVKANAATRFTPVVLVTGLGATEDRIEGINAGADDFLTKPFNEHELHARVRALVRLKRCTDDLDSAESVIMSLALTVEARDRSTAGHCVRMAALAVAFGTRLRLDDGQIAALHRGAYLHDVGKIGVPDAILLKPGPLTGEELAVMQQHSVIGDRLCGDLRLLREVRPIVRHHHERSDGSGYPDGLRGDAIPLLAQVMGVIDVYDALTNERPYHALTTAEAACAILEEECRRGWRGDALVKEFVALVQAGAATRAVRLSA